MAETKVASTDLERLAADAGLEGLLTSHRATLEKALATARTFKSAMPRDFTLADEPAHVFRPDSFSGKEG